MSKLLFDLFPLILFFAAFKYSGIYVATGLAIVASLAQVGWLKFRGTPIEATHLITLGVIVVFGGLTLAFRNDAFIKWKPTVVNWMFAAILLFTQLFSKKTAIEFVLGKQLKLPPRVWNGMNLSWAVFFIVVGLLNLYVAFWYGLDQPEDVRTETWVNFKVFGLMGLTFVFMFAQMFFIAKHIEDPAAAAAKESDDSREDSQ